MTESSPRAHVEPHEVTAYLDGTLSPAERGRFETHLAECEVCAAELVEVMRLQRRSRSPRTGWIGLAAAAAIAVVVLGPRVARESVVAPPPVRGDSLPGAALVLVAPADGAELDEPPVLAWRPVAGVAAYRVQVSRADGDSVWAQTTRDTTATPPAAALDPSAEPYYWYVDALLADGRSVGGTPHRFRLAP
jgi:anti-sigma factor RsiW